jgi:hypothetical protein
VTIEDDRTFGLRDPVRLRYRHGAVEAGTVGSVLGWFSNEGTYVVNFPDADLLNGLVCVIEVRADEITHVDGHSKGAFD